MLERDGLRRAAYLWWQLMPLQFVIKQMNRTTWSNSNIFERKRRDNTLPFLSIILRFKAGRSLKFWRYIQSFQNKLFSVILNSSSEYIKTTILNCFLSFALKSKRQNKSSIRTLTSIINFMLRSYLYLQ